MQHRSTETREAVLKARTSHFLTRAKLDQAINWTPIIIPTVPSSIRKVQGEVEVSRSMLTDEIERVCSIRPAHVKLYWRNKVEASHRTWKAYFPKPPRTRFRVLNESGIARQFKRQKLFESCNRCNDYHTTKNCARAPLCGNYGPKNHSEQLCIAATKYRKCGGPHRSDIRGCLACLTRSGVPIKEQMRTYR